MYTLTDRLRKSGVDYHLSADRRIETLIKWAKRTIRRSDMIEKELMKRLFSIQ